MRKIIGLLIVAWLLAPQFSFAKADVLVAFVRDGHIWTQTNDHEERITEKEAVYPGSPQWSHDGKLLLYQRDNQEQTELWMYDLQTKRHQMLFYDAHNPKWSPVDNIVAFQSNGVLNISDLRTFYNVALGVADYSWHPDGKGFVASTSASLHPDGWTNPIIYEISIKNGFTKMSDVQVKEQFVIPKEVSNGKVEVMAINASSFAYSPDRDWVSFIVSPTASMAMDSDMLCVISWDGKRFEPIDELILYLDDPKWADDKNLLAYIAGGGRFVFGFKNKEMKVTELPALKTADLTPPDFAELSFTWRDDQSVIVSRVKESEWSNESAKRPKPALYFLPLNGGNQVKITTPPKGKGDYQPQYLPSVEKLVWVRKGDFAEEEGELWIADANGNNAKLWVKNIQNFAVYEPGP